MMMHGLTNFKLRVKCIHFLIVVGGFLTVNIEFENLCSYYYTLIIMYKTQSRHVRHNSAETNKL